MNNVIYRKATLDDAYGIAYVGAYSWKETYWNFMPKDYLEGRISNLDNGTEKTKKFLENTDTYFVAEIDNKIVGILHYSKSTDEEYENYGHLGAIYVLKDYQGLGIGKQLFKMAIEGLINLGCNDMYLECLKGNPTLGFYEKYNGKIVKTIDYPISNFNVKSDIVEFKNIKDILLKFSKNNEYTKYC